MTHILRCSERESLLTDHRTKMDLLFNATYAATKREEIHFRETQK